MYIVQVLTCAVCVRAQRMPMHERMCGGGGAHAGTRAKLTLAGGGGGGSPFLDFAGASALATSLRSSATVASMYLRAGQKSRNHAQHVLVCVRARLLGLLLQHHISLVRRGPPSCTHARTHAEAETSAPAPKARCSDLQGTHMPRCTLRAARSPVTTSPSRFKRLPQMCSQMWGQMGVSSSVETCSTGGAR